jgi:ribonuclease Z
MTNRISRRDALKFSGAALGGLALGGVTLRAREAGAAPRSVTVKAAPDCTGHCYPPLDEGDRQRYSYFVEQLDTLYYFRKPDPSSSFVTAYYPPLDDDEMRITFMGSCIPPVRRAQNMMSIFVEVGWDAARHCARDSFVFDCGAGVVGNYGAMEVGYRRMDKVFITHLHGDHMSDLTHIYCFGPSGDRLTPLYVFGPSASGVRSPRPPRRLYDDGTTAFCRNFREAMRWHTESFAFQNTSYTTYPSPAQVQADWGLPALPRPVSDDPWGDGYAIVPVELDWRAEGGVAYWNRATDVKITHFPVIHCRKGSIGYKLEWKGLSMIYTSDTKPEKVCVRQASGGKPIDVFIHEMIVPPDIWAMQAAHLPAPDYSNPTFVATVNRMKDVQASSHTPQGAYGFLLTQINPQPRLAVATHFPVADDTVSCAMNSVAQYVPDIGNLGEKLTFSFDRMLISVNHRTGAIRQRKAATLDFGSTPLVWIDPTKKLAPAKYADPYMQLERLEEYQPSDGYCDTGY